MRYVVEFILKIKAGEAETRARLEVVDPAELLGGDVLDKSVKRIGSRRVRRHRLVVMASTYDVVTDSARCCDAAGATSSRLGGASEPARGTASSPATVTLRLPARRPFDGHSLLGFLAPRAVAGIELSDADGYARSLRLPHGHGTVRITTDEDGVTCTLRLADSRDLTQAIERCRWLCDLDADTATVDTHLGADDLLGPWVRDRPGLRVPGHVDGFEVAVRAVIGQQISVPGARTIASRLVTTYGEPIADSDGLTHLFPTADAIAGADPEQLPMPRARGRALVGLAVAVAEGRVALDRTAPRAAVRESLLALPGIGPWTADYIALRALGDPDVFLPTDLGVRQALARLGFVDDAKAISARSGAWRPWRSYAVMHLWMTLHAETESWQTR